MTNENKNQSIQMWSVKELAKVLSLSKRQIHRLNACGKIFAPIRIGGSLRFSAQECANWLAAGAPDRKTWETMKGVEE
jgi:predicted DNA-binding transcriptional regulator AlpA